MKNITRHRGRLVIRKRQNSSVTATRDSRSSFRATTGTGDYFHPGSRVLPDHYLCAA